MPAAAGETWIEVHLLSPAVRVALDALGVDLGLTARGVADLADARPLDPRLGMLSALAHAGILAKLPR
jgi:hypothetical protein